MYFRSHSVTNLKILMIPGYQLLLEQYCFNSSSCWYNAILLVYVFAMSDEGS